MRYHVYLEAEPTLESYRLSHQPRPGYGPVFICPFVVLTDSAGQLYNAMRGVQGQNKNETINMGVYQLNGQLDDQCPVLFPYKENPIAERYSVTETADFVSYVGQSWRFDFGADRYRWSDGGGRLSLEARRLGQVCTFWVPGQEGYDAEVVTHFTGRGSVSRVDLALGHDATFTLEQAGSTDWPLHTCGTVSSSSGAAGRAIAMSWNYTEFFPLNWAGVADYQAAHHGLYGRYPSFARLMKNARIKDQILVFDEL